MLSGDRGVKFGQIFRCAYSYGVLSQTNDAGVAKTPIQFDNATSEGYGSISECNCPNQATSNYDNKHKSTINVRCGWQKNKGSLTGMFSFNSAPGK